MKNYLFALSLPLMLAACGGDDGAKKTADGSDAVARCAACHSFEKDGPKRSGPNLHGILGQPAGTKKGFTYSKAMKDSGITWSAETLDAFIAEPNKAVPGNRMGFPGESDAAKRQAIIAYMQKNAAS
ncbi:c-type cytochrome [Sphingomonas sp. C3-2]|uniref:c-type cytochrome n=1 Tax=Sphingomonas sp. C3-2 TaxID=3062169 RepID=UPI00294B0C79|nr:c-type cytochrome [Sphingomonas sp. C3-2]WOK37917.1 c-type cytochrome [Sphingomonas sp. C3-2]